VTASLSIGASEMAAEDWWEYLKGSPDGRRLLNADESAIEFMTVARVAGSNSAGYENNLGDLISAKFKVILVDEQEVEACGQ
jgi:hypothetical protein